MLLTTVQLKMTKTGTIYLIIEGIIMTMTMTMIQQLICQVWFDGGRTMNDDVIKKLKHSLLLSDGHVQKKAAYHPPPQRDLI